MARAIPKSEPSPQWCCQGRGGAGTPRTHVSTHRSLGCVLESGHSHLELFRATQPTGMGLLPCGFAWPRSPFPHPTRRVRWGAVACREGKHPCFRWQRAPSRLAPSTAVYFSTQDSTKISLSHPPLSSCYGHHPGHTGFPWPLCCHSAQTPVSAIAIAVAATCSG